jgi:hypothetical protein
MKFNGFFGKAIALWVFTFAANNKNQNSYKYLHLIHRPLLLALIREHHKCLSLFLNALVAQRYTSRFALVTKR